MVAADLHHLDDDMNCPASCYWRMKELAGQLERELHETQEANIRIGRKLATTLDRVEQLETAAARLKNAKGRYLTEQAAKHLFSLLP
jgi:hypothetical protein